MLGRILCYYLFNALNEMTDHLRFDLANPPELLSSS
jgi:hypothetical protein